MDQDLGFLDSNFSIQIFHDHEHLYFFLCPYTFYEFERDLTISILKSELKEFPKGIWDSFMTYSKDLIFSNNLTLSVSKSLSLFKC
jgi:hypothetical protein